MMSFHTKDGLHFEPLPHGDIRVTLKNADGLLMFETVLGRSMFASVMALVCARGYTAKSFHEAYQFLRESPEHPKVTLDGD